MSQRTILNTILRVFACIFAMGVCANAKTIYVDGDAAGANDGTSWENAYFYLQDALMFATAGDEIRVAQGVYRPDEFVLSKRPNLGREETFQLKNGVAIRGGYAGLGQPDPNARDIVLYETVLSGDLDGNDVEVADPCDLCNEPSRGENSYHVITGSGTDETATLDGFTITGGNAYTTPWDPLVRNPNNCGAGVYNDLGSPVVINCTFSRNAAEEAGAGMFNYDSSPALMACAFAGNWAGDGGGIQNVSYSSPTLTNCIFSGNRASKDGGGINNGGAALALTSCIFAGNSSVSGGGIRCPCAEVTATNCTFVGNTATSRYYYRGGGISGDDDTVMTLTNCIFWGNSDIDGMSQQAQIDHDSFPQTHINFCCVQSWTGDLGGTGNFGTDPCFADSNNGDYHLLPGSPCIDTGHNSAVTIATDLDGNPRIINAIVDMGAYEYQGPHIFYVDADANGANDGSSWADAYNYLQDALFDAYSSSKPVKIRVSQGVYKPTEGPSAEGEFLIQNGISIYGGFPPGGGRWEERNPNVYATILSGDRNGDDVEIANPQDLWDEPSRADNTIVLLSGGCDKATVVDGFIITGGRNPPGGGGMCNWHSSPTIINCTFNANTAGYDGCEGGGGMYNDYSDPILINCTFSGNSAGDSCGGGAMYNEYSNPTLTKCTFSGNTAEYAGGGMYNSWSNPTLTDCIFSNNFSPYRGGGMHNDYGSFHPVLNNCTFRRNRSDGDGGGIYNFADSSPTLTNCTFAGNSSNQNGGGIANCYGNSPRFNNCTFICNIAGSAGAGIYNYGYEEATPTLLNNCTFAGNSAFNGNAIACDSYNRSYPINLVTTNCILWDGDNEIWNDDGSIITITYSDIRGGQIAVYDPCGVVVWGAGNIDSDPCFADANNRDYHLKSQAGRWDPNSQSWVIDDVASPCIDAGDPMSPIGHEPFPNGGIVNMGAYGGTAEASKSYFGKPPCETIVVGDVNGDCAVDFKDFALMALHWLYTGWEPDS